MSVVAAAVIGSTVIGGYTANKAAKSQEKAAEQGIAAETEMADKNIEFQREMAEQQREDFAPWRDAGADALNRITSGIASGEFDLGKFDPASAGITEFDPAGAGIQFNPERFDASNLDLTQDPGYQFRMQQGVGALDSSASARGLLLSGAQQKALNNYGQNMGSQEYANAYSRYSDEYAKNYARDADKYNVDYGAYADKQNTDYSRYADQYAQEANRKNTNFNILSSLSQGGQASAAGQAQASSQLASTGGNIMSNTGSAQNYASQAAGAARASAYQDTAQVANQAAQNWLSYKMYGGN